MFYSKKQAKWKASFQVKMKNNPAKTVSSCEKVNEKNYDRHH